MGEVFYYTKAVSKGQIDFLNRLNSTNQIPEKQETVEKKSYYERWGLDKILPTILLTRTDLCKHRACCTENACHGFIRTFGNLLSMKVILSNLFYIANFKKLLRNIQSSKANKDHLRFALFFAAMNFLYKAMLCVLRRVFKCDKYAAPLAGFVAGFASAIDDKKRRQLLTIIFLSRFCDTVAKMSVDHGITPEIPKFELAIIWFCSAIQQYLASSERDCLNPGLGRFLQKWSVMTPGELMWQGQMNKACVDRVKARLGKN